MCYGLDYATDAAGAVEPSSMSGGEAAVAAAAKAAMKLSWRLLSTACGQRRFRTSLMAAGAARCVSVPRNARRLVRMSWFREKRG